MVTNKNCIYVKQTSKSKYHISIVKKKELVVFFVAFFPSHFETAGHEAIAAIIFQLSFDSYLKILIYRTVLDCFCWRSWDIKITHVSKLVIIFKLIL